MATTTNFSFPTPDDTAYVKDGAAAIRSLGTAIDTTVATMVSKTVVDAKGDLLVGTAADTVGRLAVGTNGQVLTANSATATGLEFATPASGGGKVLQVVGAATNTTTSVTTTSYVDITNVTASITPTASNSKVLITISLPFSVGNTTGVDAGIGVKIVRGSTDILEDDSCGNLTVVQSGNFNLQLAAVLTLSFLDSPSTTSATTYKLMGKRHRGNTCGFNTGEFTNGTAQVTLMEIGV